MSGWIARLVVAASVLAILTDASRPRPASGGVFRHRRLACNRGSLRWYPYAHNRQTNRASILATAVDARVRRKTFAPASPSIAVDHVQLSRISLLMYKSGKLSFTGLISHQGQPNKEIRGNYVTVRVRAYAGTPRHPNLDNASLLWESTRSLWLPRNQRIAISLLPGATRIPGPGGDEIRVTAKATESLADLVRLHFHQTSHIELELECRHDR
jgi:hypothetical protein